MKRFTITGLLAAVVFASTGTSFAQTAPPTEARAETPRKIHHAGGRHDQRSHEAAVRAMQQGKRLEAPAVHAGGRHDERVHRAAIEAEQRAAAK